MDHYLGILMIIMTCASLLILGAVRKKVEWLLGFLMRGILGTIAIYFVNMGLAEIGISSGVGINAVTVLTSGILGFPGLVALYGIGIYHTL